MAPSANRGRRPSGASTKMTDAGSMAELMIDLEEDRLVALEAADALKESLQYRLRRGAAWS